MRILLLTPPMTQLNTPYPATAYLTGFLRSRAYAAFQADPALELILRLLSKSGLQRLKQALEKRKQSHPSVKSFLANFGAYENTIDGAVRFLQGKDRTLAARIASRSFLPEGGRFAVLDQFLPDDDGGDSLDWAFGSLGVQDRAKYMATLYLDDLVDVIQHGVDSRFELTRYGERLAASAASFDPLYSALHAEPSLVDEILAEITSDLLGRHDPDVVGLSVPFPGNMYGALRIAQTVKRLRPHAVTILGGGYVNTELRRLSEPRVFESLDFITLDDGERPFQCILEMLQGKRQRHQLLRTYAKEDQKVVFLSTNDEHDIRIKDAGTPTYDGLAIDRYLSLCELPNPMHRIWSDGRWNKLTLAHGCYWRACSFCDITLDYIARYEEQKADTIVDKMCALIEETGESGFHFVDEAAPPKLLFALSKRLLERGVSASWWGNVRFEKTFNDKTALLMQEAGCIAVSGGLEVASDRLLDLMKKGVTVEQVARVTHAFTKAGILVHAYLMYGFPSQTTQETVDALERVRQLFLHGCIQSAYWHRFALTVHSPISLEPERYGIRILERPEITFAENDLEFVDAIATPHDELGQGLRKALYNYMHGLGLEEDVRLWFDIEVPKARVAKTLIAKALGDA